MLVGEHGRIIPVRHIKGMVIFLIGTLIMALIALGVLSFFYLRQSSQLKDLQGDLDETTKQLSQLRDEKDMLLAKLVIENKIPVEKKAASPAADTEKQEKEAPDARPEQAASQPPAPTPSPDPKAAAKQDKPAAPAPASKPEVKWSAEIQDFKASYQQDRSILRAVFKICNNSKPKKFLSGRIVTIFKQSDDIPMKWLTVPRVPLENDAPTGKNGKAFGIHNFRTMDFMAFGIKPPINYDTAVVFVFTADGEMILKKEFSFKINLPPPPLPAPKPAAPAPQPVEEKKPDSQPASQLEAQPEKLPEAQSETQPGTQPETQPAKQPENENQTLFPFNTPENGSKLPSILQDNKPIDLTPEEPPANPPAQEGETIQTPPPAESSPTQPEGEKKP